MRTLSSEEIGNLLSNYSDKTVVSKLGYFSKPYCISYEGEQYVIKEYHPVFNIRKLDLIRENHKLFIEKLSEYGISVPLTELHIVKHRKKHRIVIIQELFKESELVRSILQSAELPTSLSILDSLLTETIQYWNKKGTKKDFGFHPTLRNYAIRKGKLYYFDTFPPMAIPQRDLNKIILFMSPNGGIAKKLIPQGVINLVSNEYYCVRKMLTGIIGSMCRLRPENAIPILKHSIKHISKADLPESTIRTLSEELTKPPGLSGLWRFVRRIK